MGKIIIGTGLGGIAVIAGIAYQLTYSRLVRDCAGGDGPAMPDCFRHNQPSLNDILLTGLSVALAYTLVCMCVYAVARSRKQGDKATTVPPTKRAGQHRLP